MDVIHHLTGNAWARFDSRIQDLCIASPGQRILDIGGGANPVVPLEVVRQHLLDYTLLDISEEELAKAPADYHKACFDITGSEAFTGGYDLAFSKMLAEHIKYAPQFHKNVLGFLRPGGVAIHFFPTLYAFPFIANHLIPENLAEKILVKLTPFRKRGGKFSKFPAYYQWTLGPTRKQIRRLEDAGFEIEQYEALYGHEGYYEKYPAIKAIHLAEAKLLARLKLSMFTSYSVVTLRKPLQQP